MKKHGSLILALCALAGAMTFACSDDSGNSATKENTDKKELAVTPAIMTLSVGETNVINISYDKSKDLVITSANADCVKVDGGASKNASTNSDGNLTVNATAVGEGCSTIVTVMDKEDTEVSKNVNVTVLAAGEENGELKLSPASLELLSGASDTATATYTLVPSNTPAANETLKLESSNPACASVDASVVTGSDGTAKIKVTAANDVNEECNATITVIPPKGSEKSLSVHVTEDKDEPGPVVKDGTLAFDPESLQISFSKKTGNIVLEYKDGNGDGVANASVKFDYDESCVVSDKLKKAKTDADGKIAIVLTAQKDDCTTTLTAHSGELDASAEITVTAKEDFSFTLETAIDAAHYEKVAFVAVGTSDQTCEALSAIEAGLQKTAEGIVDEVADLNGTSPILSTTQMTKISLDQKSVLAIGKGSEQSKVSNSYGCKNIGPEVDGQTVHLDLIPVPPEIIGKYDLVTNFDLTSGFEKTPCNVSDTYMGSGICVPPVEEMKAGDWVKFVTDFCSDPLLTLLEFAWSNTIDRLMNLKNDDGTSKIPDWLKGVLGSGTKTVALGALKPYLDKVLGETGEWYGILKKVAPDVNDLTTNMQLVGLLEVLEADGSAVSKAKEEYKELQYQWSYNKEKCIAGDVYGKSDCRRRIILSTSNGLNMSGEWTGVISASEKNDILDINTHPLNFKWASMLFVAVFGSILPDALGYTTKDGIYIKSFLNKVLFESLVNAYLKDHPEHEASIKGWGVGKECEAFLEVVIRLVKSDIDGTMWDIAKGLLPMACSDQFIGKLDTLILGDKYCEMKCADITDSDIKAACDDCESKTGDEKIECKASYRKSHCGVLDSFQASTANGLNVSSKACNLYENDSNNYDKMGLPDVPVKTAGEIFSNNSKTDRCTWDVDFSINEKPVKLKGVFHATRQK